MPDENPYIYEIIYREKKNEHKRLRNSYHVETPINDYNRIVQENKDFPINK